MKKREKWNKVYMRLPFIYIIDRYYLWKREKERERVREREREREREQ
jgi:hypothetical protein